MELKKSLGDYRTGAAGAVMDEYERAAFELKFIVQGISETDYTRIADAETENEDCRSIETITNHVVRSGYSYSNYIRESLLMPVTPIGMLHIAHHKIGEEINNMLAYNVELLDDRWAKMSPEAVDEEWVNIPIQTRWGLTYNIDQLFEHAIVHILRHRRQIEKFILKFHHRD